MFLFPRFGTSIGGRDPHISSQWRTMGFFWKLCGHTQLSAIASFWRPKLRLLVYASLFWESGKRKINRTDEPLPRGYVLLRTRIYWRHDEDLSGLTKLNAIVAKLATVKEKGDEKVSFERGDD